MSSRDEKLRRKLRKKLRRTEKRKKEESSSDSEERIYDLTASTDSSDEVEAEADDVAEPTPVQKRARNWSVTLNNPTIPCAAFAAFLQHLRGVRYFVFQKEQGNDQGTAHFQCYVQFSTLKLFSTVKNQFRPYTPHLEMCEGTPDQNYAYCTKEETRLCTCGPHIWGEMVRERQRSDLYEVAAAVMSGSNLSKLATDFPRQTLMYSKHMERLKKIVSKPALVSPRKSYLFIGPTRTGKTYRAVHQWKENPLNLNNELIPKESVFLMGPTCWFDAYDDEKVLVMDEFSGAGQHISLAQLLNLTDNYRTQLPVKGSMVWHQAAEIIFTTNLHPRLWYNYQTRESQYTALCARFAEVWIWTVHGAPTTVLTSPTEVEDFFNDGAKYGFNTVRDPAANIDHMRR